MAAIITVENIGKKYTICHHQQRDEYTALRDTLTNSLSLFGKKLASPFLRRNPALEPLNLSPAFEDFWALKNVSFEVKQGDRVGIIGRNGAGKSTLFKILSRITEPTTGSIRIKGRVASLLEVGTGFHPELSGRENIFLNGAILGMQKDEIRRKFDEIVDFAEIERFLDTPVKHYSSGMYVRLAFAVAAHLEPEILIVDEVLAVGDAQFQKKCLGKMGEVGREGRTVLFVSHNMEAVSVLCTSGIVIEAGSILYQGAGQQAISFYNGTLLDQEISVTCCQSRSGSGGIRIQDVWLSNDKGDKLNRVNPVEPVCLSLIAQVDPFYQNSKKIAVGFGIDTFEGRRIFTTVSSWEDTEIVTSGKHLKVNCRLPSIPLVPGKYLVSASVLFQTDSLDSIMHCAYFEITDSTKVCHSQRTREQGDLNFPCVFTFA